MRTRACPAPLRCIARAAAQCDRSGGAGSRSRQWPVPLRRAAPAAFCAASQLRRPPPPKGSGFSSARPGAPLRRPHRRAARAGAAICAAAAPMQYPRHFALSPQGPARDRAASADSLSRGRPQFRGPQPPQGSGSSNARTAFSAPRRPSALAPPSAQAPRPWLPGVPPRPPPPRQPPRPGPPNSQSSRPGPPRPGGPGASRPRRPAPPGLRGPAPGRRRAPPQPGSSPTSRGEPTWTPQPAPPSRRPRAT